MLAIGHRFSAKNEEEIIQVIVSFCLKAGFTVIKDGTKTKRYNKDVNGFTKTLNKAVIGNYFRCSNKNPKDSSKCKFRFSVVYEGNGNSNDMSAFVDIIRNEHNHDLKQPSIQRSTGIIFGSEDIGLGHYNEKVLVDVQISKASCLYLS